MTSGDVRWPSPAGDSDTGDAVGQLRSRPRGLRQSFLACGDDAPIHYAGFMLPGSQIMFGLAAASLPHRPWAPCCISCFCAIEWRGSQDYGMPLTLIFPLIVACMHH